MKWALAVVLLLSQAASTEYRCVKWAWTGDVYNRKVVCLKWEKNDRPLNRPRGATASHRTC